MALYLTENEPEICSLGTTLFQVPAPIPGVHHCSILAIEDNNGFPSSPSSQAYSPNSRDTSTIRQEARLPLSVPQVLLFRSRIIPQR